MHINSGYPVEGQSWKWFRTTKTEDHYSTLMSWQNSFGPLVLVMKHFMELPEEEQERFLLITDALMMNDLEDLKRVHNLANYLMIKRIKDNVKAAEA